MVTLEARLEEADAALAALGMPAERIDEIRTRVRSTRRSRADEDALLAGLDIDLPAPAPPRASKSPSARPSLSEEALFGDASIPDAPSPFDDLRLSDVPATPAAAESSDLAALLEGDDDVLIVGGGGMAISFDDEPSSALAGSAPVEAALEIESTEVEVLEADDFELLVDESALEGGEPEGAAIEGEEDGEDGEDGKKGFFRKLFS